jgi:ankyrin repeat protein
VKLLLGRGADVNARLPDGGTVLTCAACAGHIDVAKLLADRVDAVTLTDEACLGDLGEVERRIMEGADVNGKAGANITPLMGATGRGHLGIVKLLLDKGADVNARNLEGDTALTEATKEGHLGIVKLLLDKGADVNAMTIKGMTPLRIGQKSGHKQIVELLKAHGAKE